MTIDLITAVILGLSIGIAATSFIAVVSFMEVIKAHHRQSVQHGEFLTLLAKMETNHSNLAKSFHSVTDSCQATTREACVIIADLHKYFESNALTRKITPLNEEGNPA